MGGGIHLYFSNSPFFAVKSSAVASSISLLSSCHFGSVLAENRSYCSSVSKKPLPQGTVLEGSFASSYISPHGSMSGLPFFVFFLKIALRKGGVKSSFSSVVSACHQGSVLHC